MPHACYTMVLLGKKIFYEVLENVKFPDGYALNISKCVRKERKVSGLKTHYCHVLMQYLLPLALRGTLSIKVSLALIDLSNFFCALSVKSLMIHEAKVVVTLCNIETIFPPSFFIIMVRLVVHLAIKVRIIWSVRY